MKFFFPLIIFIISLSGCKKEFITVIENPQSNTYEPLQMYYKDILNIQNPPPAMLVYDITNMELRYFSGSNWELLSNITNMSPFLYQRISDLSLDTPRSLNVVGNFNNQPYIPLSTSNPPFWKQVIDFSQNSDAIIYGNSLIDRNITVSQIDSELYAHDSQVLIYNNVAYVVYMANQFYTSEGNNYQKISLSVFNITDPQNAEHFSIFESNTQYDSFKSDIGPCYSPILLLTPGKCIRILGRMYVKGVQIYFYRDFNPLNNQISQPQLCMVKINSSGTLLEASQNTIKQIVGNLYPQGAFSGQNNNFYMNENPISMNGNLFFSLTISDSTMGTTFVWESSDFGKTFQHVGEVDLNKVDTSKYTQQFTEGSFDSTGVNQLTMLCRNDKKGIFVTTSNDAGHTFSSPVSLNETYGYNTIGTRPVYRRTNGGNYLSMMNISDYISDADYGESDRTTLDIRYGPDREVGNNLIKLRIKCSVGCHYPGLSIFGDSYYMTTTRDIRMLTPKNVGDITIAELNTNEIYNY